MPTLQETVNQTKALTSVKLTRCKTAKLLNISASVRNQKSKDFHFVAVAVKKVPLLFAQGAKKEGPLVIDANFDKIGKLDCDFVPKVIVLSGTDAIRAAKADFSKTVSAWVGDGALRPLAISAADSLSNSDLERKLSDLIRTAYSPKKKIGSNSATPYSDSYYDSIPYLRDVYQGDSYCIFATGKTFYKQAYKIDPVTRNVTLDGTKIEVVQTYTPAPTGDVSSSISISASLPVMPSDVSRPWSSSSFLSYQTQNAPVQEGGRTGSNVDNTSLDFTSFGATNSELNTPQYRQMLNIEEALDQYLQMLLTGMHKPVGMAGLKTPPVYINAARETLIAIKNRDDVPETFSTIDFLRWQDKKMGMKASAQTKLVDGQPLVSADFAYVGDPRDISTWHLPIASRSQVIASLEAAPRAKAIPKFERMDTVLKIKALAKEYGI